MAVINIDDVYILGEKGEQVDKVTGLFTKDENTTNPEKAFARLNIGTAGSNRNLLDNPWWGSGEVVNQRAANQLNPSAYGIDRWKGGSSGSVSVTSTGLAFGSSGGNAWQPMESALRTWMVGKVFTASVLMSDGTIYSGQGTYGTGTTYFLSNPVELFISSAGNFNVRASSAATVRAVKLELGSVSTLANDAPPDYGEELAKCMRYFQRLSGYLAYIGSGYCDDTSNAYFICPLSVLLRSGATVSLSYSGVYLNSNSIQAVTGLAVLRNPTSYTTSSIALKATASGLTAKAPALLQFRAENGYIDLSADL